MKLWFVICVFLLAACGDDELIVGQYQDAGTLPNICVTPRECVEWSGTNEPSWIKNESTLCAANGGELKLNRHCPKVSP